MNEGLLLSFVSAAAVAAVIGLRRAGLSRRSTLSRLEGKLDALLKHQGIQFEPYSDLPPAVLEALHRGRTIEAIKEYRAATGADLKAAKDAVEELQRRAGHRA